MKTQQRKIEQCKARLQHMASNGRNEKSKGVIRKLTRRLRNLEAELNQ